MDYIALLQDILQCTTSLPTEVLAATTLAISQSPSPLLSQLTGVVLSRPSLAQSEDVRGIFKAYVQGLLLRQETTKKIVGGGWRFRRQTSTALEAISAPLDNKEGLLIERLAIASAIFASLSQRPQFGEELFYSPHDKAERRIVEIWRELAETSPLRGETLQNEDLAWLSSESLVSMSPSGLRRLPCPVFSQCLMESFATTFQNGRPFRQLTRDIQETDGNIDWPTDTKSRLELQKLTQSPLYTSMGRLSRLLGQAIEYSNSQQQIDASLDILLRLEDVSFNLEQDWKACPWSRRSEAQGSVNAGDDTLPWNILKSFLFAATMMHASLVRLLGNTASNYARPSKDAQSLVESGIRTFSHLHFIALAFGEAGFATHTQVLRGLSDIAVRLPPDEVELLLKRLEAIDPSSSRFLYWLDTAERLLTALPRQYAEHILLRIRPLLDQPNEKLQFEASHSFILAALPQHKDLARDYIPWYCDFIITNQNMLTPDQFRTAFSTCVKSSADFDNAIAWACIQDIGAAIANPTGESDTPLLLQTLMEQLPHIDAEDIPALLDLIKAKVLAIPIGSGRTQAIEALYEQLNQARHIAQRVYLTKWWLVNRDTLH